MIKVKNLAYAYDSKKDPILQDIHLEIKKSEYIAIIGPNGCGKTTLIRHLNGLLLPTSGDVWVQKINTKEVSSIHKIRQSVGMVFQNPDNQIVGMSVEEDVAFGPGNLELPPQEIRERVNESLRLVDMIEYAQRAPHTLSSGEKQLIAIAGILAMKPQYIALDEPTSYLDPSGQKRVMDVLADLNKQGIGIIHVTHDMDEAVKANRVLVMDKGQILMQGKPENVFARSEWLEELGLGVPKASEMLWKLRKMGMEIPEDVFTIDEMCKAISSVVDGLKNRWVQSEDEPTLIND